LLAIAYLDARTATIPNWLTLPILALAGGWRLARVVGGALMGMSAQPQQPSGGWAASLFSGGQAVPAFIFMILAWGLCFALWQLHVLGGGDSKTLMGMLALFPTADFGLFLAVGVLVLSLPLPLLRLRGKRLRDAVPALRRRLQSDSFFPTERELEEEGRPYAWTFCLPGVAYLWLLW
jgi:Flp pilus assembly protein protease CpaA